MSEILIKGMKMPKGCNECRFHDGSWCCIQPIENWRDSYYRPPEGEKQPTCPLVEVKTPHGRLGDLDALSELIDYSAFWDSSDHSLARDIVNDAPTIIEASTEWRKK